MLRFLTRLFLLIGSLGVLWLLGFMLFIALIPMKVSDPERKTDAIIVLTGGSLRIDEAIRLHQEGLAPRVFISGVGRGVTLTELLASQAPTQPAWQLSEGTVELGRQAANTAGNAEESAAWVAEHRFKTIRLVTADYHIPRSLREFRTLMPDVEVVPNPVFPEHIRTSQWWRNPGTAALLFVEYHKFLLSWFHALTGVRMTPAATVEVHP